MQFLHCVTLKKMVLYSTKRGSWLIIIGEPLLVLYHIFKGAIQNLCQMVLCRTIRGAILHCIYSTKIVLNSTNSGSLARKEPLKGLNRLFVQQWCYSTLITPKNHWRTAEEPHRSLTGSVYGNGAIQPLSHAKEPVKNRWRTTQELNRFCIW